MDQALLERQIKMEERARQRGIERFHRDYAKAREGDRGDDTQAGVYLLKKSLVPVRDAIAEKIASAYRGESGRRATGAVLLKNVDADLLAYLTLREIVSSLTSRKFRTMSSLSQKIASAVELELRLDAFEDQNAALYKTVCRDLENRGSTELHIERVLRYAAGKYEVEWQAWTAPQRLHVGMFLLDATLGALPDIIEISHITVGHGKTAPIVKPTQALLDWLKDRNEKLSVLRPALQPMVAPPRPWTGTRGGGYRSDYILRTGLVKRQSKEHVEALKSANLDTTLTGLNALQETRWKINTDVLRVAKLCWESGLNIPGVPNRDDLPLPPKPGDIADNEVTRKAWKRAARAVYEVNVASKSLRILAQQVILLGEDLKDEEAIYFPHQLDFRGRCYARPASLQPQGSDLCRGLLTFAEGKPLVDERAVGWLMIHGANCFGVDKVSHTDRIDWVEANSDMIMGCAADPIENRWWTKADSPWSFLAFCFEWRGYCVQGTDFPSHLPIALDGTCNGLQHFSAMLRDPVGGAAVNLIPSDTPQDIYSAVAQRVALKLLAMEIDPEEPNAWVAQSWRAFGIDRKITKRPVMVLPYGGTQTSCRTYVIEAVQGKIVAGKENPFGAELVKNASWLGGVVWNSIGETVVAARDAMDFLRKIAKVAAKYRAPLQWTTPSGFVARQEYKSVKDRMVKTRLHGTLYYFQIHEMTNKLDKARQTSGIAPNFVHSLDASALMLTIETALANSITSFAMIHDSYGTHAADTDKLSAILRMEFVDMYQEDVLAKFREEIASQLPEEARDELPPVPPMGGLDLSKVLESAFFFS